MTLLAQGQSLAQTRPRPRPRPRPLPRSYGTWADSLNGIPGHAFGEPRSSFPELEAKGDKDMDGYMYYYAKLGQELGWFGKNAEHVRTVYRFYQDKFDSFNASARGTDRPLLAEEAVYLFGKGLPQATKTLAYGEAAANWEGQQVRVTLFDGHNECRLIVRNKLAAAQKAAAAARAAKLCTDNAPAAH